MSYYLWIDGIPGESQNWRYQNWIDLLAWNWGKPQSEFTGTGSAVSKVEVQDVLVVMKTNAASGPLRQASLRGSQFPKVIFVATKGDSPDVETEIIKLEMFDVVVPNISYSATSDGEGTTESVALNFSKSGFLKGTTATMPPVQMAFRHLIQHAQSLLHFKPRTP